jgi:hypothetical protein
MNFGTHVLVFHFLPTPFSSIVAPGLAPPFPLYSDFSEGVSIPVSSTELICFPQYKAALSYVSRLLFLSLAP